MTTSIYDAVSTRALATITKKGAAVTFPGANTGAVYDPATDTFSGGSSTPVTGKAVQVRSDPDMFKSLNLVLVNPVTLLIAAKSLAVTPAPGMVFTWGTTNYTVKNVQATAPDGVPILYRVIGDV